MDVILNMEDMYISFAHKVGGLCLRFVDTFRCIESNVDALAKILRKNISERPQILSEIRIVNQEEVESLRQHGFEGEMQGSATTTERSFHSELNGEDIENYENDHEGMGDVRNPEHCAYSDLQDPAETFQLQTYFFSESRRNLLSPVIR